MTTEQELARIGGRFMQRREELGLPLTKFVKAVGMSATTYTNLEKGRGARRGTYARAAQGLGWRSDAFDRLLAGEDPVLLDGAIDIDPERETWIKREAAAVRALLESALERLDRLEGSESDGPPASRST